MKRLTSKRISKEIESKYGIAGVMVFCADGMCSWYSDTNEEAMSVISSGNSGVYVNRINQLSLEQWINEFYSMWQENAPIGLKL